MRFIAVTTILALAKLGTCSEFSPKQELSESYAPVYVDCPADVQWLRPATSLNPKEAAWVYHRKRVVLAAFEDYLHRLGLQDFDVEDYVCRLRESDYSHVPTLGFAISGGGWASATTGTGMLRALDSRLDAANKQRTGGLLQSMTYMSGLSGGSFPIVSFATHNFPTADEIVKLWHPEISRLTATNNTQYAATAESMFEDIGEKLKAGFNVSVSDFLGRAFSYEFVPGPHGGLGVTFSSVAHLSKFIGHEMPFPLLQTAEAIQGDVEYFGLEVPFLNGTICEFTPFEFGAWSGSAQSFTPMEWAGTRLNNGSPVNCSACVRGFDRAGYLIGTASAAFNFWYIEDASNGTLAPFGKRSMGAVQKITNKHLSRRQSESAAEGFPVTEINAIVAGFKEAFGLNLSDISYAWYPNPFMNSPSASPSIRTSANLKFLDNSEIGQALPLWSQIQPERNSSFIIAWDHGSEAGPYNWNNGSNLHATYLYAANRGIPFPIVPTSSTFVARNYTTRPVLFGCDANRTTTRDTRAPIVAYLANAPYSAYTNFSYTQTSFSPQQINEIFVNSFDIVTQGNGTLDAEWAACLGCAAVERSLEKVGMRRTPQCQRCFDTYCWDGTEVEVPEGTVLDPSLALDPGVSFAEWNLTSGPL